MGNSKKTRAFTLVELIVVIVILAILATIAFLSFSSQSASARDSTRLSDMSNIAKGLSVFSANAGTLPKPDNNISILASGVTIGYQGYAMSTVLNMIKISNGGKDPLDSTYYTYSTNQTQSKFELLGFLEDGSSSALSYIPFGGTEANADPSSYSGRYVMTKGDPIGILLQSGSMVPAQVANANIDVISTTGSYTVQYSPKEQISGTGISISPMKNAMKTGGTKFPGCDNYDVAIGSQVWAGCNSTQGNGVEWGKKDDGTNGSSAACYNYNGTEISSSCQVGNPSMASNAKESSWTGATGVAGSTDGVWGKLYDWDQANSACPNGWRLPSDNDFEILETSLNGGVNCRSTNGIPNDGWKCNTIGWPSNSTKNSTNNYVQALKMPMSGFRSSNRSTFSYRGWLSEIWTSTNSGTGAYERELSYGVNGINRVIIDKSYSLSVRCIRN